MKAITRFLLSPFKDILGLGYGKCDCCGYHWNMVKPHSIDVTESAGCFATCWDCWESRSDEEIKKAYDKTYDAWLLGNKYNKPVTPKEIGFTKKQMMTALNEALKTRNNS